MIFWLILIAAITTGSRGEELCSKCRCHNAVANCTKLQFETVTDLSQIINFNILIFDQNNIHHVKRFPLMKSLQTLSMKHNNIFTFDTMAFYNLTSLHTLDLSFNKITRNNLKPDIFKGPLKEQGQQSLPVKVLKLGWNELHSLNSDVFEYLNEVEELYLERNEFHVIDHSTLIALSDLHELKVLNLSGNMLRELPYYMFNGPKKLQVLDISFNKLKVVPGALEFTHPFMRHVILSGNPIEVLNSFPKVYGLEILELNWMIQLKKISSKAFTNLTLLREFHCSHNSYLTEISPFIFEDPPHFESVLAKMIIKENRLGYLDENVFSRWDQLEVLELDQNPWICDCKNDWMLETLLPIMKGQNKNISSLTCYEPEEMSGRKLEDLMNSNVQMRCLDYYGNRPERDAKILIIVLLGTLISIPIALVVVGFLRKPSSFSSHYPRAYYKRAVSVESIGNENNMKIFHT